MKKSRKFKIATGNGKRIIKDGFESYMAARDWILMRDYGQFESECGWYIFPYLG